MRCSAQYWGHSHTPGTRNCLVPRGKPSSSEARRKKLREKNIVDILNQARRGKYIPKEEGRREKLTSLRLTHPLPLGCSSLICSVHHSTLNSSEATDARHAAAILFTIFARNEHLYTYTCTALHTPTTTTTTTTKTITQHCCYRKAPALRPSSSCPTLPPQTRLVLCQRW